MLLVDHHVDQHVLVIDPARAAELHEVGSQQKIEAIRVTSCAGVEHLHLELVKLVVPRVLPGIDSSQSVQASPDRR